MQSQTSPLDLSFGLRERVAVVTGGASGIGAAIARTFAVKEAQVAIVDLNGDEAQKRARELGQLGAAFPCHN